MGYSDQGDRFRPSDRKDLWISNNNIVAGVDYTIPELITMTVVPSSNVSTLMLANLMSNNDPDAFIRAHECQG